MESSKLKFAQHWHAARVRRLIPRVWMQMLAEFPSNDEDAGDDGAPLAQFDALGLLASHRVCLA